MNSTLKYTTPGLLSSHYFITYYKIVYGNNQRTNTYNIPIHMCKGSIVHIHIFNYFCINNYEVPFDIKYIHFTC